MGRPNGGDVIILRSVWSAILSYLLFILLKHMLDPGRTFTFSATALQIEAHSSLPIFGALLGAIYASLYARFSSQWNYLAGLYNKLLEAELRCTERQNSKQKKTLAYWKASFIEDAEELHLATKKMFVPAILSWLSENEVREAFCEASLGSKQRLANLEKKLQGAIQQHNATSESRDTSRKTDMPDSVPQSVGSLAPAQLGLGSE